MSNAIQLATDANRRALRLDALIRGKAYLVDVQPVRLPELPEETSKGFWVERRIETPTGFLGLGGTRYEYHFIPHLELESSAYRAGRAVRSLFTVRGALAVCALAYGAQMLLDAIEAYRAAMAA